MTPIQHLMLGVGASKKTYLDDVFSTQIYNGNGGTQTITNGIDLSSEGGAILTKRRDSSTGNGPWFSDTVRGINKYISTSDSGTGGDSSSSISAVSSTGYSLGSFSGWNNSAGNYASWSFRKAPGFFDVVTYTGNGTGGRTISHSLGSVPGCIIIKCTSASKDWQVGHRGTKDTDPWNWTLKLNSTSAAAEETGGWNDTAPTSSVFSLGTNHTCNLNGETYVAYVFAGGESIAATARSVSFDGNNDTLSIGTHADFAMGTGDLTFEGWFKKDAVGTSKTIYHGTTGGNASRISISIEHDYDQLRVYVDNAAKDCTTSITSGQWYHFAWTRQGTTSRLFLNGIQELSWTDSIDYAAPSSGSVHIGSNGGGSYFDGDISNFRIVKGTAVYTSSFRPPTEPLTNITNTKLLCCNNSSVTGATVTPGTISQWNPTASTDSPFDDPAAFTFGASKEGIIKCGSYVGNGNDGAADGNVNGPKITLGFEPAWLLIKRSTATEDWQIYDCMRGIPSNTGTKKLAPNNSDAESGDLNYLRLSADGFQLATANQQINADGDTYIYMAIRRPDGYVGKPPELGTDVFAMDTGNATASTDPAFDSGFPVDFAFLTSPASSSQRLVGARLMQGKYLRTDASDAQANAGHFTNDSNEGWKNWSNGTGEQAWMFKRGTGFDVVAFKGNLVKHSIPHNLGKTPEMMWVKNRDHTYSWYVYHKGLNGGSSPQDYVIKLDTTGAESTTNNGWGNTAPTSTHFTVSDSEWTNGNDDKMLAMLFASVDGISKVGSYSGPGGVVTITTGFQPRFIMVKKANDLGSWHVFDTTRGMGSGNDPVLMLNNSNAQVTVDYVTPSSTGWSTTSGNLSEGDYIYYAHA